MTRRTWAACLVVASLATTASAEDAPQRVLGFGMAGGGGVGVVTLTSTTGTVTSSSSAVQGILLLPTLEAQVFLNKREWSLDLSIPLLNIVVVSAVEKGVFFIADLFFDFNLGNDWVRFVAGPGLGFTAISANSVSGASLRIPAELGVEFLTARRHLGLKLLARPYLEIASGAQQAVGGGFVGLVGFSLYVTKKP